VFSITYGEVSFDEMCRLIKEFINKEPKACYNISVGTDNQNFELTKTVLVVAVHRISKGGIFFYEIRRVRKITSIRQKLFTKQI